MSPLLAILFITILGAGGGLLRSLLSGFEPWGLDSATKLWKPGWPGHIFTGAVAAFVVWAIYGPFAGKDVTTEALFTVTLSQIAGSILSGIAGAEILQRLAERRAEEVAKLRTLETIKELQRND